MRVKALTGQTTIVIGASRGIGLATARHLSEAGANVVLTSRQQEAVDAAAQEIGSSAVGFAAHAADEDTAHACLEFTIDSFGSLDILVNNRPAVSNPRISVVWSETEATPETEVAGVASTCHWTPGT